MAYRGSRSALQMAAMLDEAEQSRLLSYLASPFCTGLPANNECLRLMQYFFLPVENDKPEAKDEESLHQAAFPGLPFSPNRFNRLMSDTYRLIKKFVVEDIALNDIGEREESLYLLRFYKNKQAGPKFWAIYEALKGIQFKHVGWEAKEYYWNYLIEHEVLEFSSMYNLKKDDLNLLKTMRAFEEYFFIEHLTLTCLLLTQNQVVQLVPPPAPLEELLPYDPKREKLQWFFSKPLGRFFLIALQFMGENPDISNETFEEYDRLLQKEQESLSRDFLISFERFGINFLIRQYNLGNNNFLLPLFRLLKRRVDSGRVYQGGKINTSEFQSAVNAGLKVGEFDWVYQFLINNQHKISGTEHPEDFYMLNLANYYFYKKEFEEARKILFQANYEEMQYKFSCKTLEIQVLFELQESQWLNSRIDAAKVFFSREEKITAEKREMGTNFVNMVKRILNPETPVNRERILSLISSIKSTTLITERQWLTQKLQDMLDKLNGGKPG